MPTGTGVSIKVRVAANGRKSYRARFRLPGSAQDHYTAWTANKRQAAQDGNAAKTAADSGTYVPPAAGRETFKTFTEGWRAVQGWRPTTAARTETILRLHVYPVIGHLALSAVQPLHLDAMRKRIISGGGAETTADNILSIVAGIMKAAVANDRIGRSPFARMSSRRHATRRSVTVPTTGQVQTLRDTIGARYAALVTLTAATGLRQGEAFGLTWDRVDLTAGTLTVDRQLVLVPGTPLYLGPPKTSAGERTIPLGRVAVAALRAHRLAFPPTAQPLHAGSGTGPVRPVELVFTAPRGGPLRRGTFGPDVWAPVALTAGLPSGTGMHCLRHYYAALLIHSGASVKTVQAAMGHATAAETLDTYGHLWPDAADQTRDAVDAVLGDPAGGSTTGSTRRRIRPSGSTGGSTGRRRATAPTSLTAYAQVRASRRSTG